MTAAFCPWPCCEFSTFPLADDWSDGFPEIRVTASQYDVCATTFTALFRSPSLEKTYLQLKDYCFCQGALSNANVMDMEFFSAILGQDLAFFRGHLGVEIQEAFPLEKAKYPAIDLLRASHFDLYRVETSPVLGFARLASLTDDRRVIAFTSLDMSPGRGEILFGRLLPLGRLPRAMSWRIVEPFDTIAPEHADVVLTGFQSQFDCFRQKFPGTTKAAFLKIAAYHVYELIQSRELSESLNNTLKAFGDSLYARIYRFTFGDGMELPVLTEIAGAKPVTDDGTLVCVPISDVRSIQETLREAIVSREDRVIEVTVFLKKAADRFVMEVMEPLVAGKSVIRQTLELDDNAVYRSLRHLFV